MQAASASARSRRLILPLAAMAAITAGSYWFGTSHSPNYTTSLFGHPGPAANALKSWIATGVLSAALVQLVLALWMYGLLPGARNARRLPTLHRAVGIAALLATLPVAYHCMFAYGVQRLDARTTIHSLAGCFLYGAAAAKIAVVRTRGLPRWALPAAGGLLVTTVVVLWYTSALWYYNSYSLPSL